MGRRRVTSSIKGHPLSVTHRSELMAPNPLEPFDRSCPEHLDLSKPLEPYPEIICSPSLSLLTPPQLVHLTLTIVIWTALILYSSSSTAEIRSVFTHLLQILMYCYFILLNLNIVPKKQIGPMTS